MKITLQVLAMVMGSTLAVSAAHAAGAFDGCTNLSGTYLGDGNVNLTVTQTDCRTVTESYVGAAPVTIKMDGSISTDASGNISKSSWVNGQMVTETQTKDPKTGTFTTTGQGTTSLDSYGDLVLSNGDAGTTLIKIN